MNRFFAISKRVLMFLAINLLVVLTISLVLNLLNIPMTIGDGQTGLLIMCLIWGMGGAFISLALSRFFARVSLGVQLIDPRQADGEARWLVQTVYDLAARAQIRKMPQVGIYNSPEVNAFATGPTRNRALVAVSTGLLQRMDRREVEGVLGHEIAHIANGDMVTMTLIQGIVNAFVMFLARIIASVVANGGNSDERRGGGFMYYMLVMAIESVLMFLAMPLVMWFSRQREFRADRGGALFAGKDKMIAALRSLQRSQDLILADQASVATLKISGKSRSWMALFSTHPSLEERIERLQRQA